MKKILRNLTTEEGRNFWDWIETVSKKVETWPPSARAGINVSLYRSAASDDSYESDEEQRQCAATEEAVSFNRA
jgi:hypothetical protein